MIEHVLGRFAPIGLGALGEAALMDRVDRKFLVPRSQLEHVLAACETAYRVLEIRGVRASRYVTQYFDSPDFAFYHAHHAGRASRTKIRVREYLDGGGRFLELKQRGTSGRTRKSRVPVNGDSSHAFTELRALPDYRHAPDAAHGPLNVVMTVAYTRVTLVRRSSPERVTLDFDVQVSDGKQRVRYPHAVFAEVKQAERGDSPFVDAARALGVREGSISKYCLGVVNLVEGVKKNRFKPVIARLEQHGELRGILDCA